MKLNRELIDFLLVATLSNLGFTQQERVNHHISDETTDVES